MVFKQHSLYLTEYFIALALLVMLLTHPVSSFSTSYSWREFIILHYGAVVRATLDLNLNSNIWSITSPLTMNVELLLVKSINVSINAVLKMKYIIGSKEVYEESWYLGKLSKTKRAIVSEISVYPKAFILKKVRNKEESLELTLIPKVELISSKGMSVSDNPAPFHLIAVSGEVKDVKIAYSTTGVYENTSIVEVNVMLNAFWDPMKDLEPIGLTVRGFNFNSNNTVEIIAQIKTNTTLLTSTYVGSFTGEFNTEELVTIPQDYLKTLCENTESVALNVEVIVIGEKMLTITIPIEILYVTLKPDVYVEVIIQENGFAKQKIPATIRVVNNDEKQEIFLEKVKLIANNTLIFEKPFKEIVSEESEKNIFTHVVFNETGSYAVIACIEFRDYTLRLFKGNSTTYVIKILNPLHLKAKKNKYDINEKVEFTVETGLPEVEATLQYKLENSSKWVSLEFVKLKFPETSITVDPLGKPGRYMFRVVTTNGIVSNEVVIEVSRKIMVKASPSYLEVKPGTLINLTVTITPLPPNNIQLVLLKQENTLGQWVPVPNASVKKMKSTYMVSFKAPLMAGIYVYKVDLISGSKVVSSSNSISIKVVKGLEKRQVSLQIWGIIRIGSGVLPIEVYIASLSTLCLLSFIFWRRYKV